MPLVGYSDSEESDTENKTSSLEVSRDCSVKYHRTSNDNPLSKKAVDHSETRKIRINISEHPNHHEPLSPTEAEEYRPRPVKRVRTGGTFNSFNAFLPMPKNTGTTTGPALEKPSKSLFSGHQSVGIGSRVNLKTGASPSFSKEPSEESIPTHSAVESSPSFNQFEKETSRIGEQYKISSETTEDFKLKGKPTMFKPLSVGRKQLKAKQSPSKKIASLTASPEAADSRSQKDPTTNQTLGSQALKKPLFSTYDEEALDSEGNKSQGSHIPLESRKEGAWGALQEENPVVNNQPARREESADLKDLNVQTMDLRSVADGLGLTAAQKRQLFGRDRNAADTTVTKFSLAAEYSHNNKLMETQAAIPAHNPVRGIAPGKHSLQQLVNAAASQKDALEESFSSGKRNKRDAGSRYGW